MDEPHPRGLFRPIPYGRRITLTARAPGGADRVLAVREGKLVAVPAADPLAQGAAAQFRVVDLGLGRAALAAADGGAFVSVTGLGEAGVVSLRAVAGKPGDGEAFQWTETPYGDLVLLSLASHRLLRVAPDSGAISADDTYPAPDGLDGTCFVWVSVDE